MTFTTPTDLQALLDHTDAAKRFALLKKHIAEYKRIKADRT